MTAFGESVARNKRAHAEAGLAGLGDFLPWLQTREVTLEEAQMYSPIENRIGQVFVPATHRERAIEWYSALLGRLTPMAPRAAP